MTILELQEQRNALKEELSGMANTAQQEERKLNEEEETRMNEVKQQIADIDKQIEEIEAENRKLAETKENNKPIEKTFRKMGLIKAINDVVANRAFDEATSNEVEAAREEFRKSGLATKGQIQMRATVAAKTPGAGQENVAEEKAGIEVALRNALIASRMGANFLGGLVGDLSIPKYSGSNCAWADENQEATDGAGNWSEVLLSPKRLTAYVDVSKEFLLQDSNDAEAMLIRDLANAIAEKLDQTIFGDGAGSTKQPKGLMNEVMANTALDAVDYKTVLDIEEGMEEVNANDYMFICSPSVKFALKGVQKANGLQMILEGQEIDGQKYISSNSVKKNALIAIDPKSLVIGEWGGIDITVDPFTQAAKGAIRLVVNAYFDAGMKSDRIKPVLFS